MKHLLSGYREKSRLIALLIIVIMCVNMVLPSFGTMQVKAGDTTQNELIWTGCDKPGWWFDPDSGNGLSYDTHNAGKDCVTHAVENKQSILVGYRNMDNPINISGMDYIEFDLYMSETDIFSAAGDAKLELTSYDWVDNKEINYSMKDVSLNAGWNHVKLALADFSAEGTDACDKEAITFMRLYAAGHSTARTMTVKVDDVKFTKEGNADLVWTDCDNPGWWFNPDSGTELSYDTHSEGKDCVINTVENAQSILVGYRNMDNPIDITEMDYIEFDLYVSETDIFSAAGDAKLELTSYDWVDNKEINYSMKDVSLNAGWNHVKLALADFGTEGTEACNKEAITFMRLYAAGHGSARTMTIKLDNVTFAKEVSDTPEIPEVPDTPDMPDTPSTPDDNTVIWTECNVLSGWFNPTNGLELSYGTHYEENDCVSHTVRGTGMEMAYRNMANPVDISKMDYMEFDLYVSDADIFSAAGDAQLELTSYDWVDNQEINYYLKNLTLSAGWNHIKLTLEDFTTAGSEACNKEAITFMRIYTVGHASRTMTMMLDDIKFTKDPNAGEKEEEVRDTTPGYITGCDSRVGWSANSGASVKTDKTDKKQGNASIAFSGTNMGNLEMIYRFDEMDLSGAQYLEFDLYVSDIALIQTLKHSYDMQVELSSSGKADKEEVNWDADFIKSMNLKTGWNHVRLPMVWATSSGGSIELAKTDYFRIYMVFAEKSDFTFKIDGLKVDKGSGESASALSIDCDTVGGWKSGGAEVSLDTTNVKQGTGSVKFTANNEKNVTVFANFQPVDISSANAIQFYLWVSDVTLLESASDIQLEITSGGEPDKQEIHWNKEQLLDCVYEDGWNLVTLAFDDAEATGGNIDYKAMNYIRLYIVHEDGMDLTMNFDDIKILKIKNFNAYKRPKNITLRPENNELYLSKGDSLRGWSTTEKSKLTLDRENKVDGKGSIKLDAVEMVLFQHVFDPFNLEFANCLEFDLYVDSLKHFNAEDYQVELSSNSDADDAEIHWTKEAFMEMDLKQGWNHIVLFFDDATESKALGNSFDSSSVSYFRLYMVGVESAEMRIDNLKATYREVEKDDSQPTIPDMEIEVSKKDKQVQETNKDVSLAVVLATGTGLIIVALFIVIIVLRAKKKKTNGLQQGGQ